MRAVVAAEPIPLVEDADGVLRVAGTRIPLDTVVIAFDEGATPEEICSDFPSLRLEDVYATITYYLRHRPEVEEYLARRQEEAERLRAENEARFPSRGLRERLRARRER